MSDHLVHIAGSNRNRAENDNERNHVLLTVTAFVAARSEEMARDEDHTDSWTREPGTQMSRTGALETRTFGANGWSF